MKTLILAGTLLLAVSTTTIATEPQAPTLASLNAEVDDLTGQLREAQEEIRSLKERLATVEDRLGNSFGGTSPFNTIERRLEELERDNRR